MVAFTGINDELKALKDGMALFPELANPIDGELFDHE